MVTHRREWGEEEQTGAPSKRNMTSISCCLRASAKLLSLLLEQEPVCCNTLIAGVGIGGSNKGKQIEEPNIWGKKEANSI